MLVNAANLSALFTNLRAEFNRVFSETPAMWDRVATLIPSGTGTEDYAWIDRFPKMREWLGDKVIKAFGVHDYTIKNKSFEATIAVKRDHIDDDTLGIYGVQAQQAGQSAREWPDSLVFPLLKNGFTGLCYDGQYFFDTDHPVAGASVSNFQGGAGIPWFLLDTRHPLRPLIFQQRKAPIFVAQTSEEAEPVFKRGEYLFGAESRGNAGYGFWQLGYGSKQTLSKSNFDAAVQAMEEFTDEEGSPLGSSPNLLVVPPSLRATARDLIKAERDASGATNTLFEAVDVLVTPWVK